MPARTNEFQHLVATVQSHMDPGATVDESAMLIDRSTGTQREVDVCVRGTVGGQDVTISVECRDRGRVADVTWVDEMHAKHARLPTNLLVLVSHSGFSGEAQKVAALHGIRCLTLADVDPRAPERLFPDVGSLWGKAWNITIDHVLIDVSAVGDLLPETVRVAPDNALFLSDGTPVGEAADLAAKIIRSDILNRRLAQEARPEHVWLECGFDPVPPIEGKQLCLQKLDPLTFRPIARFHVAAKCVVAVDEFPLRHGNLGSVRVAWGKGELLGQKAMLVVTDGPNGARLSLQRGV